MMLNSFSPEVNLLPTNMLEANTWNPNQMTTIEFQELVDEIERLGRLPKPIVVRPKDGLYEIIDGEHSWLAAKQLEMTEVPCEIIQADDFEAMTQTYKRNQHGKHSPVLEGVLFHKMSTEGKLSLRELAGKAGISEGTIRNRMQYASAAELRNRYAGADRTAETDGLHVRQVRAYLDLPQPLGDLWLDAGGKLTDLGKNRAYLRRSGRLLNQYAFVEFLDVNDFGPSFMRLVELAEWAERHQDVAGVQNYVRAIAATKQPSLLAWILPIRKCGESWEICIDEECWQSILEDAEVMAGEPAHVATEVASLVYEELEAREIDPAQVYDAVFRVNIETLLDMPDYLRFANELSVSERTQLFWANAPVSLEVLNNLKQKTVELLRAERIENTNGGTIAGRSGSAYVLGVFLAIARAEMDAEGQAIPSRGFDRPKLLDSIQQFFAACPNPENALVSGRPALDVLRERIDGLETPEVVLLSSLLNRAMPAVALGEWMDAMHDEGSRPSAEGDVVCEPVEKPCNSGPSFKA